MEESASPLAITVEWKFPKLNAGQGPKQPPVTRFSIPGPISMSSLSIETEKAQRTVNEIMTHIVEKGSWPDSLPDAVVPSCPHGFPYTEKECMCSPSHWTEGGLHPNHVIAKYVKQMMMHSPAQLLADNGGQLDMAYGEGPNEKMDIYGVDVLPDSSPVFAFVHGGYWQEGSRKQATAMVPNLFRQNVITAVIGYDLAPSVSLEKMIEQIGGAIRYLNDWCTRQGSAGLYLCGHSAGAHLIASVLMTDVRNVDKVNGVFLFSGVYDLIPLIGTYIDRPLGLTQETATNWSPSHQIGKVQEASRDVLCEFNFQIVVGGSESPFFIDQSRQFFEKLDTLKLMIDPGYHVIDKMDHFALVESMDDPDSILCKLLCRWMGKAVG